MLKLFYMIYLESVKINKFPETYSHGISLKLNENICYYITSKNINKINSIYNLLKSKQNYLNGNILINNNDIAKLDKNNLDNYYYKTVAFCEKTLFFNEKLIVEDYLKIIQNFSNKKVKLKIKDYFQIFKLNSKLIKSKISKLNNFSKIKLLLLAGIYKNTPVIVLNAIEWSLNATQISELKQMCDILSEKFSKTILIFGINQYLFSSQVDLDLDSYYQYNNRLTINEDNLKFEGYKLIKHNFNVFTVSIKQTYKIYLLYIFITLILMICSIFVLTILNQNSITNENDLINYIKQNDVGFYVLGYGLFALNLIVQAIISFFWYKSSKKYLLFLSTFNIHNLWVSLLIPIVLIISNFFIITISYLINIVILNSVDIKYNIEIWNTSLYTNLVYIIETFIISYILILRINNISNFYKIIVDLPKN